MPYVRHLYYEQAGAGRPVILVHCPALSHLYWRPVVERLRGVCRCIAIDVRGHGRSGMGDTPWRFADIAADITMLVDRLELDQAPVLVGYSSGGSICLQAALDAPHRYAGLVLIGGLSEGTTLSLRAKTLLGLWAARAGLKTAVARSIVSTNHTTPLHRGDLLQDALRVHQRALVSFFEETLRANCTARLGEIDQPVLLLYGQKDEAMHPYYQLLRRGLRRAETAFVPGSDHRVPTRKPRATADLVAQFVARLVPRTEAPLPLPHLPWAEQRTSLHPD